MNWSNTAWAMLRKSPNCALPDHQRVRIGEAVAVFEGEHGIFDQRRVDHLGACTEPVEDAMATAIGVVQDQMSLGEGATRRILSAESDGCSLAGEAGQRERFGEKPS